MIIQVSGDILYTAAGAVVVPVNTKGVMGAGLARQIAAAYPGVQTDYQLACAGISQNWHGLYRDQP